MGEDKNITNEIVDGSPIVAVAPGSEGDGTPESYFIIKKPEEESEESLIAKMSDQEKEQRYREEVEQVEKDTNLSIELKRNTAKSEGRQLTPQESREIDAIGLASFDLKTDIRKKYFWPKTPATSDNSSLDSEQTGIVPEVEEKSEKLLSTDVSKGLPLDRAGQSDSEGKHVLDTDIQEMFSSSTLPASETELITPALNTEPVAEPNSEQLTEAEKEQKLAAAKQDYEYKIGLYNEGLEQNIENAKWKCKTRLGRIPLPGDELRNEFPDVDWEHLSIDDNEALDNEFPKIKELKDAMKSEIAEAEKNHKIYLEWQLRHYNGTVAEINGNIVDFVSKLDENEYTPESWNALQKNLSLPEQRIDKAGQIRFAVDSLVIRSDEDKEDRDPEPNPEELSDDEKELSASEKIQKILDNVFKLKSDDYTPESWGYLQSAIDMVDKNDIQVDIKLNNLKIAFDGLKMVEINKTENETSPENNLTEQIEKYNAETADFIANHKDCKNGVIEYNDDKLGRYYLLKHNNNNDYLSKNSDRIMVLANSNNGDKDIIRIILSKKGIITFIPLYQDIDKGYDLSPILTSAENSFDIHDNDNGHIKITMLDKANFEDADIKSIVDLCKETAEINPSDKSVPKKTSDDMIAEAQEHLK